MSYRRRRGLGGWRARRPGAEDDGSSDGAAGPAGRHGPSGGGGRGEGRGTARWLIPLGAAALLFLVGYVTAAVWLFPNESRADDRSLVRVPDLVGLTEQEAQERLERLGLQYTLRAGVSHPQAPEGAVLAQNPLPAQYARPGAPVHVTLSRGPERYVMPDVTGLSERQATIVLERLGFKVTPEVQTHTLDAGRAVGTRPEAGTEMAVPADVVLVVSAGRRVALVPDLVGRHVDDVDDALAEAGLELGAITYDPGAMEAPGRVTGQYPPAGYSLREGGAVEVRVAGEAGRVGRTVPPGTRGRNE